MILFPVHETRETIVYGEVLVYFKHITFDCSKKEFD